MSADIAENIAKDPSKMLGMFNEGPALDAKGKKAI